MVCTLLYLQQQKFKAQFEKVPGQRGSASHKYMEEPICAMAEPLLEDAVPRSPCCNKKALAFFSLLLGMVFTASLSQAVNRDAQVQNHTIDMAWQGVQPWKALQSMQPVKASPFLQPVDVAASDEIDAPERNHGRRAVLASTLASAVMMGSNMAEASVWNSLNTEGPEEPLVSREVQQQEAHKKKQKKSGKKERTPEQIAAAKKPAYASLMMSALSGMNLINLSRARSR